MEGMGIWIFLLLFYLLQALTKRKQKQQRMQQTEETNPKPQTAPTLQQRGEPKRGGTPQKPQRPVSLEDLFNPNKLRDILGVPQQETAEKPKPKPVPQPIINTKEKSEMRKGWEEPEQSKPSLTHEQEVRDTVSKVASVDITDVDESTSEFKSQRMAKSDITSDRFDKRKTAPGKNEAMAAFDFFDEPQDIRNAVILKEILDRPRAFRRQIR